MAPHAPESHQDEQPRILILCHEYPRPDVAASNRRLVDVLEMLAKRVQVDLFCPENERRLVEPRYEDLYKSLGVRVIFGYGAELKHEMLRHFYDICLFEWWVTVPSAMNEIRRLQPWSTLIVDAVDVCFLREEAALALGRLDPAVVAENRHREIEAYRGADALLAVTSEDTTALRDCGLEMPIFFIPMIEPIQPRRQQRRDREILFVGTFGINPGNVDGVLWFAAEVWPSVRAAVPEARWTLIGSNVIPEIERLGEIPGIQVAGFVPDLKPYLDRVAVSIAPIRFGGGMKGKVTQALSHGIPLVTTSFGTQGLKATSGVHLIVADDARAFAEGVIALLKDEERAEGMGRAGQEFIAGLCSPRVVEGEVRAVLSWAASSRRVRSRPSLFKWAVRSAIHRTSYALRPLTVLVKRLTPRILWNAMKRIKKTVSRS